jgi:hypothetical protein
MYGTNIRAGPMGELVPSRPSVRGTTVVGGSAVLSFDTFGLETCFDEEFGQQRAFR